MARKILPACGQHLWPSASSSRALRLPHAPSPGPFQPCPAPPTWERRTHVDVSQLFAEVHDAEDWHTLAGGEVAAMAPSEKPVVEQVKRLSDDVHSSLQWCQGGKVGGIGGHGEGTVRLGTTK